MWEAFFELTTERQIGMGLGPIPASAIRRYACDVLDIDHIDAAERFASLIRSMDDAYLSLSNPANKTDPKIDREVAAEDVDGARELMKGLVARKKKQPDST